MASDKSQYRGYEIRLREEWSNWCASVQPLNAEVPMLGLSPLNTLSSSPSEALAAAKRYVDQALGQKSIA